MTFESPLLTFPTTITVLILALTIQTVYLVTPIDSLSTPLPPPHNHGRNGPSLSTTTVRKSVSIIPVSLRDKDGGDTTQATRTTVTKPSNGHDDEPLVFHTESEITLSAIDYNGPLCRHVGEGMETLVKNGFAVFESEDAMFATLHDQSSTNNHDNDENDSNIEKSDSFNAQWMKQTHPSEFQWTTTRDVLSGTCRPFSSFAQRFHSALTSYRPSAPPSSYYVGSITLCGPITRSRGGDDNNVYSLHRDPCFLTSLYTRQEELRRASLEAERELLEAMEERKRRDIEAGIYVEEDDDDDDEDYDYDDEEEGEERVVDPLCAEVLRVYGDSTMGGGTDDSVTVRQVNFWLPHGSKRSKHLVFLSREASAAVASLGQQNNNADINEEKREIVVSTENGNQWLTAEGLRYVEENMPDHLFVTNRPLIFISGNAQDLSDPIFHCGAVVKDGDSNEEDENTSCSTEIRIAVCSKKT